MRSVNERHYAAWSFRSATMILATAWLDISDENDLALCTLPDIAISQNLRSFSEDIPAKIGGYNHRCSPVHVGL